MTDETPVEVLPGQMTIEDTDTASAEVHHGAVHEFDVLPEGYAKVIQPMREYTPAEEFALDKSMELYGFQGAIVCDQYGRILDGHHRQRLARLRGLGMPHTITHVRDDAHATEIARALNTIKRHYPRQQRLELVQQLREQGFSSREMAVALGVSQATVIRDIWGSYKVVEPSPAEPGDSNESPRPGATSQVTHMTRPEYGDAIQRITCATTTRQPERIQGRTETYPAKRPNGQPRLHPLIANWRK